MLEKIFLNNRALVKTWASSTAKHNSAVESYKPIDGTTMGIVARQGTIFVDDDFYLAPDECNLAEAVVSELTQKGYLGYEFSDLARALQEDFRSAPAPQKIMTAETEVYLVHFYSHIAAQESNPDEHYGEAHLASPRFQRHLKR